MSFAVQVECYSGYTYAQEPRGFEWQGQRYVVERVVKHWRTPAGPAFRVEVSRITDSQSSTSHPQAPISNLFDLHYREAEDKWMLTVRT